ATEGPGYVWHCHLLEHEDNEMMRPYKVIPVIDSDLEIPLQDLLIILGLILIVVLFLIIRLKK
ncbi:MAG TPA: hypothetical protein ENO13_02155, partial [Candidatus Bathyarchaeota archaeon]|nr:hypothetical protein [Candidatus Bathyarchaeota archaeon]